MFTQVDNGKLRGKDKIVISGISGLFPQSRNVKDLSYILYNKINPITSLNKRWKYEHPDLTHYTGNVPELERFDAQFFKVHYRLALSMDTMGMKLLEHSYQAIFDAGINPGQLSGRNIGVYVGCHTSESEKGLLYTFNAFSKFGIMGCSKSMFANRISYWLNTKGPSLTIDGAGCSSTIALKRAYEDIKNGVCDGALVCGCSINLHPQTVINYSRMTPLSMDNKARSFDENANGQTKSEGINVLFIQKQNEALRIYGELVHVKGEYISLLEEKDGGPIFGYNRNILDMTKFLSEFYNEAAILPQSVEYIEAFGSASLDADKTELETIDRIFCTNNDKTILVGNVTSNIGYGDAVHGISAIIKVLLSYHTGYIAANLHLENPRKDIPALRDGRICIVTEHQKTNRGFTAVNDYSITGINSHTLLHGNYKPKDRSRYQSKIPHLVLISGRQESSVQLIIDDLKSRHIDPEELGLLRNIFEYDVQGHMSRGYIILDTNQNQKTQVLSENKSYYDDTKKSLWFVYSGMGSQWTGMGEKLMQIPVFSAAIEKCQRVLEPKGIDLVNIITSTDETIYDNILNSFVGIAAIQIGLTDILLDLDIIPDKIIGHSVGELGCGYADGSLTVEEMILAAYYRGYVSLNTPFIRGSMAAVGLGYQKMVNMCPSDIEIACHNSAESCTLSGPAESMRKFIAQLTSQSIFAKEVPCSNIAYHSHYISKAGPELLRYLNEVIKSPKLRSERWVSTSVPQENWYTAKYCSAEYYTNNLLNPVLFEETSRLIPENAVLIEVAPHGLLQAILKRSLPKCLNIPLARRKHPNNLVFFLDAVGRLYQEGFIPRVKNLYAKIDFPVSTETPMLSHLVEWSHDEIWPLPLYESVERRTTSSCRYDISLHDHEYNYLKGHVIRDQNLYPFAGTLVAVWDTLTMFMGMQRRQISVNFQDVYFYSQSVLHNRRQLRLSVTIQRGTGRFEVSDDVTNVATGYVHLIPKLISKSIKQEEIPAEQLKLNSKAVYSLLRNRDYRYEDLFQSIYRTNVSLTESQIMWSENWVTFIDALVQLHALKRQHYSISQLKYIRNVSIDVKLHRVHIKSNVGPCVLNASLLDGDHITRCGGVTMDDVRFVDLTPVAVSLRKLSLKIPKYITPTKSTNNNNMNQNEQRNYISLKETVMPNCKVKLQCKELGNLNSLYWAVTSDDLEGADIKVKVHYAGINYLDSLQASRGISRNLENGLKETDFGMDYSGTMESNGTRVMGLVENGAVSSHVQAHPELLWPVPSHWSLEDAATVPLAYCLAYYCLIIKYNNLAGKRIFVQGGAGALGQAVISIALANGCEVYTTVSDVRKKHFLRRIFPNLCDDHIANSRDISFGDTIMGATNGSGCDLVLICAKGEMKSIAIRCCGFQGIAIDLLQAYSRDIFSYGMSQLFKSRSYSIIDIGTIFRNKNQEECVQLQHLMSEGIACGHVRPLTRVTYAPHDVTRAFRLLTTSNHRGRILIDLHSSPISVKHNLNCSAVKSNVIISEDEEFGLLIAEKLVQHGVKKLLIVCPNIEHHVEFKMQSWRKRGIQFEIYQKPLNTDNISDIINQGNILGCIEGIHISITSNYEKKSLHKLTSVIKKLDMISRKLCPDLKYFSVLNGVEFLDDTMFIHRVKDNLPVTVINLSAILKIEDTNNFNEIKMISRLDIMDAFEQSLISEAPIITVYHHKTNLKLMDYIATIADIELTENRNEDSTLFDLGMPIEKSNIILDFLRNNFNISIPEDKIPFLTIKKIQEIDAKLSDADYEDKTGPEAFISYVDPNEVLGTTEIVLLPTRATNITMRSDEFDLNQTYLCIIPGLEGSYRRFTVLCERLKLPALVLQSELYHPEETISDLAHRHTKTILKKTGCKNNFYLLGYEIGVLIALEMAAILEQKGLTGTVYCIGGGPVYINTIFEQYLNGLDDEEAIKQAMMRHMIMLMAGNQNDDRLRKALQSPLPWRKKMEACISLLLNQVTYSAQYMRAQIETAIWRFMHARNYAGSLQKLRSKLIVLQPANHPTSSISNVENLQDYSECPVAIHMLQAPISSATYDLRCASIINQYLSEEILQNFEKKNLCETYLLNPGEFIRNMDG